MPSNLAMGLTEKMPSKEMPEVTPAPYKLLQVEGKGRGLVATRTLEVGELVLSEKAFLKIPSRDVISKSFCHLDADVEAKLMNLSCPADAMLEKLSQESILENMSKILLRKFGANRMEVLSGGGATGDSVVFETMSMINHSCMPNVAWFTEEEDDTRKEVRVCRRIQEGEEILASYIELDELPLKQKRREMLKFWNFECRWAPSAFYIH